MGVIAVSGAGADALILCGGRGERLRAVLPDLPKPLAEVGGRLFLEILLDYLRGQGFSRTILCAGYKGEAIEAFCRRTSGAPSLVVSREPRPLGTGGAIKNAETLISGPRFAVMNGDSYCPVALREMLESHEQAGAAVTIAVSRVDDVSEYGSVRLGPGGEIHAFNEKTGPRGRGWVSAGVYVMERSVLSRIPAHAWCSLELDLFPSLVGRGLLGYCTDQSVLDIGTPERLLTARAALGTVPRGFPRHE